MTTNILLNFFDELRRKVPGDQVTQRVWHAV
jgi:hypothetical protein